jgi:hypothetical protein
MDHALNADNAAYALDGRGQKPLEVPPSKRESEAVPSLFRALRCAGPLKLIPVCSPFGYLINHAMTAPTKFGGLISSLLVVWGTQPRGAETAYLLWLPSQYDIVAVANISHFDTGGRRSAGPHDR